MQEDLGVMCAIILGRYHFVAPTFITGSFYGPNFYFYFFYDSNFYILITL